MAISRFPNPPLPEDRLSERERGNRIQVLDEFSKRLKKEKKRAGIDDRNAIRQLLIYVGKRLDLLDFENRHARGLAQYDSLLGRTAKPVPQGLIGVAADAVLDLGLKDREKMIRGIEGHTESLIAEVSLLAPEIDKFLDQRQSLDKDNYVLRPSSCLPEGGIRDEDAPSKSESAPELPKNDGPQTGTAGEVPETGDQNAVETDLVETTPAEIDRDKSRSKSPNGKVPRRNPISQPNDEDSSKEWLEPRKSTIRVNGKTYGRIHLADKLMQLEYLTLRQRDVVVLWYGYDMRDAVIGALLHVDSKTVYDHRHAAESKLAEDSTMMLLLKNLKRRNKRSKEEEDPARPELRLPAEDFAFPE